MYEHLWDDCDYSLENYVGEPATDEDIAAAEQVLGYHLPEAYKALVREHNGGILDACVFTLPDGEDIYAEGLYGIDPTKMYSLVGPQFNAAFWVEEWEYPADVGLAIADTPSAGHDMIFLDYRSCGPEGEPAVVHIDNEFDNTITFMAENFDAYLAGLHQEIIEDDPEPDDVSADAPEAKPTGLFARLFGKRS